MIDQLVAAMRSAQTIAIISHISPDGDTCGSGLALYRALVLSGKKPLIFCADALKENLCVLLGAENYRNQVPDGSDRFDLAIAVDCADAGRLGAMSDLFVRAKKRANVDHHKTNERFGDINIVEGGVSATCEVIYKIIKRMERYAPCLDDGVAKLLYTGIVTDSGGFTYSSVSAQTHTIAADLIRYDIRASEICEYFLKRIRPDVFALKNRVLSRAKFYEDGKIGMIEFLREDFETTHTSDSDTDGIINEIRNVEGVEAAVSLTQMASRMQYKVSVRTTDRVDASRIAGVFGGGGHKNAAGCRLSGFYEDVKDKLLKACRDEL